MTRGNVLPTFGRAIAFVALLVVTSIAASSLFAPLAARFIIATGQPVKLDVIPELIAVFVATWLMARSIDRRPWSDMDLHAEAAQPKLLAQGFALGSAAILAVCVVLIIGGWLRFQPAPSAVSWLGAAARTTLVLAPAALAEEM